MRGGNAQNSILPTESITSSSSSSSWADTAASGQPLFFGLPTGAAPGVRESRSFVGRHHKIGITRCSQYSSSSSPSLSGLVFCKTGTSTGSQVPPPLPVAIDVLYSTVERCMFARSLSPVGRTNQKGTRSSFAKAVVALAFGADAAEKVAVNTLPVHSFIRILN